MTWPRHTVALFQRALLWWTLGWAVAMLVLGLPAEVAATPAIGPAGGFAHLTHALARVPAPDRAPVCAAVLVLLAGASADGLWRGLRWWSAGTVALLFHALMHAAWPVGHGGMHLMANLLLGNVLLAIGGSVRPLQWLAPVGLWAVRFQVLIVYATTAAHKLTGVHWPGGTAVGIVATDPGFGGAALLAVPGLAPALTWAALAFQVTFPLMVWWRTTRRCWLAMGAVFHLLTGWWIGVPEMSLAFIAAYTAWTSDPEAARMLRWCARTRPARSAVR
ncbi:MAG: hypothetical protein RBT71_04165 [Flavobacteriales bacterium]|jgi:hypothetical protein|nr:hypothetical protein [Flavobacteriales bacterium]